MTLILSRSYLSFIYIPLTSYRPYRFYSLYSPYSFYSLYSFYGFYSPLYSLIP